MIAILIGFILQQVGWIIDSIGWRIDAWFHGAGLAVAVGGTIGATIVAFVFGGYVNGIVSLTILLFTGIFTLFFWQAVVGLTIFAYKRLTYRDGHTKI